MDISPFSILTSSFFPCSSICLMSLRGRIIKVVLTVFSFPRNQEFVEMKTYSTNLKEGYLFRLLSDILLPALMISILCDVRLRTPHKFEWLTLDSCWGEDCVAPNVEDVVIKEFQNQGEYCHCWDNPDEVVRVVLKITVRYNLGRETKTQQDDELNKVEDVESCLSNKGWNV